MSEFLEIKVDPVIFDNLNTIEVTEVVIPKAIITRGSGWYENGRR